ncbi:MAG: hypothetical protein ACRCXB_20045 [Aeromonadaceae bacterium]
MPKPSTPAIWASGKSFGFTPSPAQQAQGFDYIATVRPGTGAPITDDHDWPLNQITNSLKWILDSGFGYGSAMIGVPIPWPLQQMPQDIWPECGMKFIAMSGQSFSASMYPLLAIAYPSLVIPDMRADFIRGWDNGRGIDAGRTLLSHQNDAIRNFTGVVANVYTDSSDLGSGVLRYSGAGSSPVGAGASLVSKNLSIDVSRSVPTANDNRPANTAFLFIVRAA